MGGEALCMDRRVGDQLQKPVDVVCSPERTSKPMQGRCLHYELDVV